jgi:L-asparaginase II
MVEIKTFVTRGKIIESVHLSKCVIQDYNYRTIFSSNHDNDLIYPRSAIKIFQALPFVASNACEIYNLSTKQMAISCASHCGEPEHLAVLNNWLKKIKIKKNVLKCGIHNPLTKRSSDKLLLSGKKPDQLHNNCAGKHLAMISGCLSLNLDLKNYLEKNHAYQKLIRKYLEYFTNTKITRIQKAVDGCSAPQYAFPLKSISIAMINLLKHFKEEKKYSNEVRLLLRSISKYPHLTGSRSIYPSQLMSSTNGRMFCKTGAEGVLLFAHKEKKIGGVIKVMDGNERALPSVANQIFKKLNILNKIELSKLSKWGNEKIYNHARLEVGNIYTKIK